MQKEDFVRKLRAETIIALGNGNNDRKMLRAARIGVVVCMNEGCAVDAISSADILVNSTTDELDLLPNPKRLEGTMLF